MTGPTVSVVVPTRNEAPNIEPLVRRLRQALSGIEHELCFVDDSDDATPAAIAALGDGVRCLHRSGADRAGGLSTAVVAGLHMAQGRWVCVMDADLQHPPETIPGMLAEGEAGADLVVASRYEHGGDVAGLDGRSRRLVSRCATEAARLLFREARRSSDPLSGFFLCRRAVIDGIEFRPVGFKILLELLVCVPGLRVRDVPVRQERRAAGDSKASLRQGLLFAGHLRSLFLDVPGSARLWKFALVGTSGLAIFLPVLWALATAAGLPPLLAFVPAFALSAAWNSTFNWRWTFADQRVQLTGARRYFDRALLSGALMFAMYALLVLGVRLPVLAAGAAAAAVAMASNALFNRDTVSVPSAAWAQVAIDQGVQAALSRLAAEVGADRAFVVPPHVEQLPGIPGGLLAHAAARRRPLLLTEEPSHRSQRRSNIEVPSHLVVPLVDGDRVMALVVCERGAARGFDDVALATAVRAAEGLVPVLTAASSWTHPAPPRHVRHTVQHQAR